MLSRILGDNPFLAFFRDVKPHELFIVDGLAYSEGDVRGALDKFKVENWGYLFDDQTCTLLFHVLADHVNKAIKALKLAGIELIKP